MKELKPTYTGNSSFKLQDLIEKCLQDFKLNDHCNDVRVHLIDDLVSPLLIKGEKEKLKEVIDFLLINAVDQVNATKIVVSLKQLLKTQDEVLLEFTVEDNGIKNIFNPKEGLFIYKRSLVQIRHMIQDFGGKAEISCLEGIGTTVKFLAKFKWEAIPEQTNLSTHNNLTGKKILVVEDNEINQKIISFLLKKETIDADFANDGKEAIELFEKKVYDLILLDLQMPYMDGFETANYIRKILKSEIPIIAMTAGAYANEQIRCFEIGINQYLSKPFTPEALFQRLKYLLLNEHDFKQPQHLGELPAKAHYNLSCLKQNNDAEQVTEILEMFIHKTPVILKEIKDAFELKDMDEVVKKTAKLKGSLGSLHMQIMLKIVDDIEVYIRLEDIYKIPRCIVKLNAEYDLVAPLLQKELKKMSVKA